nr:protein ABHD11-like isoform X1 [Macaca nemestrina]
MGAGRGRSSSRNWAGLKTELGGAPSESGRRSVGRPYLARCEPDNVLASMLRCTRAWRLPLEGLGPHSPSFARVPVAPSSSGGRGEAEPRPLPLSYSLLDGEAALPAVIFLHGLFGCKTNFNSIAKAFAQQTGRRISIGAGQ